MKEAIEITQKRRKYQDEYNKTHNITPKSVSRNVEESLKLDDTEAIDRAMKAEKMPSSERAKIVKDLRKQMMEAADKLEFEKAAALRDEIKKMRKL